MRNCAKDCAETRAVQGWAESVPSLALASNTSAAGFAPIRRFFSKPRPRRSGAATFAHLGHRAADRAIRRGRHYHENRIAHVLFLARRAIEARAAALHDSHDRSAAARPRARGALAVVDREGVLEIAERAVGLAMIAQGRAARCDRLLQHLANGLDERLGGPRRRALGVDERPRLAQRRKPRAMQRLADVDVAEPGDAASGRAARSSAACARPPRARRAARRRIPPTAARRRDRETADARRGLASAPESSSRSAGGRCRRRARRYRA